ncbi:hypothetical protein J4Q44_G00017600, partial [Coregonus suidteri]
MVDMITHVPFPLKLSLPCHDSHVMVPREKPKIRIFRSNSLQMSLSPVVIFMNTG